MNYMLNKRKSNKAAGASPQTPLGELSALPQTPLLSREGEIPLPYPPPVVNIFIRPPLFQNPGSAPDFLPTVDFGLFRSDEGKVYVMAMTS